MSVVRPYYLLGPQSLNQLAVQLRAALAPLAERWWPNGAALQLSDIRNFYGDIDALAENNLRTNDVDHPTARYLVQRDDAWLALFGAERTWLALAEGWLGCKVAASELVQTLIHAFCNELFCALTADNTDPELRTDVPWSKLPSTLLRPGAGTLLLEIAVAGVTLHILASAALWPSLAAPSTRRSTKKLTACHTVLGACSVQLRAMLPTARIPLTDIATLAVGDFLNLGHDLSGRVQLQGTNITLTLPATVGQQFAHKAIQLTGIQPIGINHEKTV